MAEVQSSRAWAVTDGSRVSYRVIGKGPAMALVHGGSAHGGWWSDVARILGQEYKVIVPDLTGHGHSDHRESYGLEVWAGDVRAATSAACANPVFVVGHSMGGAVGIWLAAIAPELVAGLILVDTSIQLLDPDGSTLEQWRRPHRCYATRDEALSRFRLLPPGTIADGNLLRRVAEESVVHTSDGWTWRFDPATRGAIRGSDLRQALTRVACPIAYISGENSTVFEDETIKRLEEILGRPVPLEIVPDAFHHISLDAPNQCATLIKSFISQWRHAEQ